MNTKLAQPEVLFSPGFEAQLRTAAVRYDQMVVDGFTTKIAFSLDFLRERMSKGKAFLVTAKSVDGEKGEKYVVLVRNEILNVAFRVRVQPYISGAAPTLDFQEMVVTRDDDGSMMFTPGSAR